MEKRNYKFIGLSSQSAAERVNATSMIPFIIEGAEVSSFDKPIYRHMSNILGIAEHVLAQEEVMNSFLGKEWSYVREERFTENDKLVFKPIRYYLTPKQIFTRLKFDMRVIHSDIWVNAYFIGHWGDQPAALPVQFPNEADGILNNDGIVIRLNYSKAPVSMRREDTIMDHYDKFTHVINYDSHNELQIKLKMYLDGL